MSTKLNVTREDFHLQVELLHAAHTHDEVSRLYAGLRSVERPWGIEHARTHAAWYLGHPHRVASYSNLDDTQMIDRVIKLNNYTFVGEPHGHDMGNG